MRYSFLLLLCLLAGLVHAETPTWVQPDDVRVTRRAEGFRIEVDMQAPVPPAIAWQVLVDFANMARFSPNLESSRIVESRGNTLKIEQAGSVHFGPFSQHFVSVREITLTPQREILAKQLSGTSRHMESRMLLKGQEDGTRLEYRAEIVPETALPPLLGPVFIRHEMAEQFSNIINEMVKRNTALTKPSLATGAVSSAK